MKITIDARTGKGDKSTTSEIDKAVNALTFIDKKIIDKFGKYHCKLIARQDGMTIMYDTGKKKVLNREMIDVKFISGAK